MVTKKDHKSYGTAANMLPKRNFTRWTRLPWSPVDRLDISLKIEDLRPNKTTGKLS
jgi:uncharacterized membrane protein